MRQERWLLAAWQLSAAAPRQPQRVDSREERKRLEAADMARQLKLQRGLVDAVLSYCYLFLEAFSKQSQRRTTVNNVLSGVNYWGVWDSRETLESRV